MPNPAFWTLGPAAYRPIPAYTATGVLCLHGTSSDFKQLHSLLTMHSANASTAARVSGTKSPSAAGKLLKRLQGSTSRMLNAITDRSPQQWHVQRLTPMNSTFRLSAMMGPTEGWLRVITYLQNMSGWSTVNPRIICIWIIVTPNLK